MKRFLLLIIITSFFGGNVLAVDGTVESTSGKITEILPSGNEGAFYLKIDNLTIPGNRYYYLTNSSITGTQAGCTRKADDVQYQALISVILLAYSLNKTIDITFCRDTNNNGLITNTTAGNIKLTN